MWHDFIAAIGLMLVLEGIFPFLNPRGVRQTLAQMAQMGDPVLRLAGFGSMLIGLLLLYVIR